MKEGRRRIAGCTCARGQARLSMMALCANMQLPLMPLGTLMPSLFVLCCRDRGVPGTSTARHCKHSPNRVCHADDHGAEHEQVPVWHGRSLLPRHSTPNLASNAASMAAADLLPLRGSVLLRCTIATAAPQHISLVVPRSLLQQPVAIQPLMDTCSDYCSALQHCGGRISSFLHWTDICASMTESGRATTCWPNGTQIGAGGKFGCVPSKF